MAFEKQPTKIPAAIGPIRIAIDDPMGVTAEMKATFYLEVYDQQGQVLKELTGDLVPHLSTAQRNGLIQLMQDLRALAVAEILP